MYIRAANLGFMLALGHVSLYICADGLFLGWFGTSKKRMSRCLAGSV